MINTQFGQWLHGWRTLSRTLSFSECGITFFVIQIDSVITTRSLFQVLTPTNLCFVKKVKWLKKLIRKSSVTKNYLILIVSISNDRCDFSINFSKQRNFLSVIRTFQRKLRNKCDLAKLNLRFFLEIHTRLLGDSPHNFSISRCKWSRFHCRSCAYCCVSAGNKNEKNRKFQ